MKKKSNEVHINVTEEGYQHELASGIAEEALLKPGLHTFRRGGFRERHPEFQSGNTESRNVKVCVTIQLDLDVLNYFKERATQPGASPFETQINNELRAILEHETQKTDEATSNRNETPSIDNNVKSTGRRKHVRIARRNKANMSSILFRFNSTAPTPPRIRNIPSRKLLSIYLKPINNSFSSGSSK
jgi:uncharacterized protein (DUF4415 family)